MCLNRPATASAYYPRRTLPKSFAAGRDGQKLKYMFVRAEQLLRVKADPCRQFGQLTPLTPPPLLRFHYCKGESIINASTWRFVKFSDRSHDQLIQVTKVDIGTATRRCRRLEYPAHEAFPIKPKNKMRASPINVTEEVKPVD